ncbi:MAG: hypothetical protein QM756_37700 [Polyangiaceae bacterium]
MALIHGASHRGVQALDAGWQLCERPNGAVQSPEQLEGSAPSWSGAEVPGTVASAERARGVFDIDHPRDYDAVDWWYRLEFAAAVAAPGEHVALEFGGLSGLCEVWCNGEKLLTSSNMFLRQQLDVTRVLRETNQLYLRFAALGVALEQRRPRPRWKTRLVERQQLRWFRTTLLGRIPAWSPRVVPVGPYRAVRLVRSSGPRLLDARLTASLSGEHGVVQARFALSTAELTRAELFVGEHCFTLGQSEGLAEGSFRIERPRLWWPHTHGSPELYAARLRLEAANEVYEFELGTLGFRQIALSRGQDDFALSVNGVELFCRGACWTSEDIVSLGGESAPASVELCRAAGMNMLRVGGTMVYENDAFYEACDRAGILVWQDFMFANLDYPGDDPEFAAQVEAEARDFLSRTEARACLSVLCGGSEVEQQAAMLGLPREAWTQALFERLLPELTREYRGDAVYLSSSPTGGALPFQADVGVTHYYGVGAYLRPLEDARRAGVKFSSECLGFANIPEPVSLEQLLGDGQAPFHHPRWKARSPRDSASGYDFDDVRDHYTRLLFGVDPSALRYANSERALALGRIASGEVIARTLSEWRRGSSTCRGALVWFLKDLWLGAGWGLLDANGTPKAAYYFAKRAMQAVAVFISDEGLNGLGLHLLNETSQELEAELCLSLWRDGRTLLTEQRRELVLGPRSNLELASSQLLPHFLDVTYAYRFGPPAHDVSVATLKDQRTGELLGQWTHHPLGLRTDFDDELGLQAEFEPVAEGELELTLRARAFAWAVAIDVRGFAPSDAYFDLLPGVERRIRLKATAPNAKPRGFVQPLNARQPTRITLKAPRESA